ncbi:MAG TPA: hypothetical protein VFN67_42775 [Polyangiales bacterium]|jgi:hypothetical protein|nr:hypothetical protein [Polyangiales bacterium]
MTDTKQPPKDIAILSGPTEDGQGARVVRIREGGDVSAGEIRPVRDGEPINQSELVRLHPLDAQKRVCAVEVLHAPAGSATDTKSQGEQPEKSEAEPKRASGAGPVRVSNAKYRQNWSVIFGGSDKSNDGDWSLN